MSWLTLHSCVTREQMSNAEPAVLTDKWFHRPNLISNIVCGRRKDYFVNRVQTQLCMQDKSRVSAQTLAIISVSTKMWHEGLGTQNVCKYHEKVSEFRRHIENTRRSYKKGNYHYKFVTSHRLRGVNSPRSTAYVV